MKVRKDRQTDTTGTHNIKMSENMNGHRLQSNSNFSTDTYTSFPLNNLDLILLITSYFFLIKLKRSTLVVSH